MDFIRNFVVIIALSVLSHASMAQQIGVSSGLCGQTAFGSAAGTLIRFQNKTFVITSADHVLNGTDAGTCHQGKSADGKTHVLTLVRFDVAAGLALLSAPDELATTAVELKPVAASLLMKIRWDGGAGRVSSARSTRHHFSPEGSVLEIKGSPLSSNLIGQPVLNEKNELVGMIANQFIEEVPGQGARVRRFLDTSPTASSVLLALPAERLALWVQNAFAPGWRATFEITPQDQLARVVRWSAGPLRWTQNCPPPDSPPAGGDFPIGGVDPVGIGGDSAGSPACLFTPEVVGSAPARAAWNARIVQRVNDGQILTLRLAAHRHNGVLLPLPAVSMGQFAQLYFRADVDFLITRKDTPPETDPLMVEFRQKAKKAFAQVVSFSWGQLALRQRAYLATLLSQTEDWRLITVDDLQRLTDECYADDRMIIHIPDTLKDLTNVRRRMP